MREVARYAFEVPANAIDADTLWGQIQQMVERWIDSKGSRREHTGTMQVTYQDGRIADLSITSIHGDDKSLSCWSLREPTDGGVFATSIQIARSQDVFAVSCDLAAGATTQVVAPVRLDPRCPTVVRGIIDLDVPWSVGSVRVSSLPKRFDGADGGKDLAALIFSESRSLPLVVVSEYSECEKGDLQPQRVARDIARDLAGLAIVAVATDSAAWAVADERGVQWSCYNGAIRIYWPMRAVGHTFRHPLWTSRRLIHGVSTVKEAENRIRRQFRRMVLGLSTLTIHRHSIFDELERADRHRLVKVRRAELADRELLDLYEKENERLEHENAELRARVSGLEIDLVNANAMREWAPRDAEDDVPPVDILPPQNVGQAVERAKQEYAGVLVFGDDVDEGVRALAENAGPPDKVLDYLGGLAMLAEARRKGPLAATVVQWLKERNYAASTESDTIKKSRAEMQRRTWHDGISAREFDLHLKPSEATSPDRCVRIYFDWDDEAENVVIGWIGRHP